MEPKYLSFRFGDWLHPESSSYDVRFSPGSLGHISYVDPMRTMGSSFRTSKCGELVVEPTHLKHISQIGNLPQIRVKIQKKMKPPPT